MQPKSSFTLNNIDDKYLLASILQKSIRLGLTVSSQGAVEQLFKLDKNYLMYRLMIIAFEDVGIANLELMKRITSFKWGVRKFKEKNIDFLTYFNSLSIELAQSAKDRSAADAVYLLSLAHQHNDIKSVCDQNEVLAQIWQSWNILGFQRYSPGALKSEMPDNLQAYKLYLAQLFRRREEDFLYVDNFYSTQVEPFFLSLPVLGQYTPASVPGEAEPQSLPYAPTHLTPLSDASQQLRTDFPLSAIDGHTRNGSMAIRKFIFEHTQELREIFSPTTIDNELLYQIVKKCLFRVEGQTVTPQLKYSRAVEIKALCQQKECEYFFPQVSWAQYVNLGKLIKSNLFKLDLYRLETLEGYTPKAGFLKIS